MTTGNRRLPLLGAAFLLLAGTSCGDTEDAPSLLTGPVHVGAKVDQPGFSEHQNHTYVGFESDLTHYLGERIGFSPKMVDVISAKREAELQSGAVDLVIATYSITEKRQEAVDMVGPYLITHQGLLVSEDNDDIKRRDDVNEGTEICTVEGSTAEDVQFPNGARLSTTQPDYETCVEEVIKGNADAVFTDLSILYGYAQRYEGKVKVLKDITFGRINRYGIGIRKGQTEDCRKLVRELGTYLRDEWTSDFKDRFPAIVEAYPDDWESTFKPEVSDLNTYSSCPV